MPNRTAHFLTSALVSAAIIGTPLASQAGGTSHMGTHGGGMGGMSHVPPPSTCAPIGHPGRPSPGNTNIRINKSTTIQNNIHVYKPVTVTKNYRCHQQHRQFQEHRHHQEYRQLQDHR